jgi:hypothetical protein
LSKKQIFIVTSDEFYFTGKIALSLIRKGWNVRYVNVKLDIKSRFERKLKIAILLGPQALVIYYIGSWYYKLILNHCVRKIAKNQLEGKLAEFLNEGEVFLINYPEKLVIDKQLKIHNCHPGKLPEYRGLMPIPRAMLDSRDGVIECVSTVHLINEHFDMGYIISESVSRFSSFKTIFQIYQLVYMKFADQIDLIMLQDNESLLFKEVVSRGVYRSSIDWSQIIDLKINEIWQNQFLRFIFNGGFFGLISWALQIYIFESIKNFYLPLSLDMQYSISVMITFSVVVILNYLAQKKLVFRRAKGSIQKFIVSSIFVIAIVAIISYILHNIFNITGYERFVVFAYPLAAMITAPLAFIIKKFFVFKVE